MGQEDQVGERELDQHLHGELSGVFRRLVREFEGHLERVLPRVEQQRGQRAVDHPLAVGPLAMAGPGADDEIAPAGHDHLDLAVRILRSAIRFSVGFPSDEAQRVVGLEVVAHARQNRSGITGVHRGEPPGAIGQPEQRIGEARLLDALEVRSPGGRARRR